MSTHLKAVVMAGGEGTRLRPITANRPKPMVPIVNRPIMAHILEHLVRHGVTDVVATLFYLSDEIQNAFGDGADYGVRMTYTVEDTPLGTAGSVKQAEEELKDGTFFIVSGDALTDCDLTRALAFHRERGALATIVLTRVPNPLEFGIVITEEDGRVVRFLEKPGWSEVFSDTVNTGIYILEPEILRSMTPGRPYDWSRDIFPALLAEGAPLYGYVMDEYWCDVGTIPQYMEAQQHVLAGQTSLRPPGEEVRPGVWIGEGTIIDDQAQLVPPVCIGRNSRVKRMSRVGPYTVLGDSTLVEEGASIERSVVWDSSYIGLDVTVRSAVIGSRVTIKRDTKVMEDAVVGDRCLIDVGCTIRPRIKIWPDKLIERGSTLTMSLVWGNKWRGSLFRDIGVAGLSNIEITPEFATRFGLALGTVLPQYSRVVASRDSARSSRMIKRSIIASLLSTGCNVLDMRGTPLPVIRHHVKASKAVAAINTRKLPGNARLTLLETFDGEGHYIAQAMERKVESVFYREEFQRIDSDELGVIDVVHNSVEAYRTDYFRFLEARATGRRRRIAVDYGFSSISPILPPILQELGVQAISLNAYNDARRSPRSPDEIQSHLDNLGHIVGSLEYAMGVLFANEGETLYVVDDRGRQLKGHTLFAALCLLTARTQPNPAIVMTVTAPSRLEELLHREGATVTRSRSNVRDLMAAAAAPGIEFAGEEGGGFIFPCLGPGFDAMFALGRLLAMLEATDLALSDVVDALPEFQLAYEKVECPWETKGTVMRRLAEEHRQDERVEMVDGIKVYTDDAWILVRPDSFEPVLHVFAESPDLAASHSLVAEFADKIRGFGTLQ